MVSWFLIKGFLGVWLFIIVKHLVVGWDIDVFAGVFMCLFCSMRVGGGMCHFDRMCTYYIAWICLG